jgi:glycosyltransferase involved in cell wall biosynthesis
LSNPFISIIIPTLDAEGTLSQCLESVVSQLYQNFEVIIIDGISTDKTLVIAEEYCAQINKYRIISEKDLGIYDAMNKGITLAKGEWLYFLGSDDIFYNDDVLSTIFGNNEDQDQSVIYGNVLINGDTGWANDGQVYDGEFTLSKLIEKNICHQAMFFNKKVFHGSKGFNLKYSICADWDMNFRLWASCPFTYTDTIIAVFRGGNSSFKIANNYTEAEKWGSILKYFKLRVLSKKFSNYSPNFLALSRYYKKRHNYLKSCGLKLIYYVHNKRINL